MGHNGALFCQFCGQPLPHEKAVCLNCFKGAALGTTVKIPRMLSTYGTIVLTVAFSPFITLALGFLATVLCEFVVISPGSFCSRGGGIGDDNSFIAICNLYGFFGWVISLPAAGVLALLGRFKE
jgi:hypothetical protein